jgi:regulator of replication initiation timing
MGIIDNAKELATAVHEIKNLELYERVLNLNAGILDLVDENRKLRIEIEESNKKLELHQKMNFNEPFYYQDGDKTPFCSACWETKKMPVHVTFIFDHERDTRWDCPSCKHTYMVSKNRSSIPATGFGFSGPSSPHGWMR